MAQIQWPRFTKLLPDSAGKLPRPWQQFFTDLELITSSAAEVSSFEGRTGDVTAAAGDYNASEVVNDSGVTGANVDDALDTLDAAKYESGDSPSFVNVTQTGYHDLTEISEPASPAANVARFFARDVSGRTEIGVKRNNGTVLDFLRGILSVKDFGAVGDNSTDDSDAIDAAIAAATPGDVIFFPAGIYRITRQLVLHPRITFKGVQYQHWPSYSVSVSEYSAIAPTQTTFEDDCLIRMLDTEEGGYSLPYSSGQRIENLILYGRNFLNENSDPIDGIFAQGEVVGVELDHVTIYDMSGSGIHTDTYERVDTSKVHPKGWQFLHVSVQSSGSHGYHHEDSTEQGFAHTDMSYLNCWAATNEDGYHIEGATSHTDMSNCRAHFNRGNGYYIEGNSRIRFVGCDTDRNNMNGWHLECQGPGTRRIHLIGCDAHRDGANDDMTPGGYAGFNVVGDSGADHVPVLMVGCSTGVTRNDQGGGIRCPDYGLKMTYASQVSVSGCNFDGTVAAINDAQSQISLDATTRLNTTNPSTGVRTPEELSNNHVLIATNTISSPVADIEFTDIPPTFRRLILSIEGLSHNDGGNADVLMRVSVDNGSSYDSDAADYTSIRFSNNTVVSPSDGAFTLGAVLAAASTLSGLVILENPSGLGYKNADFRGIQDASGTISRRAVLGAYVGSASPVNALIIVPTAGSFDAGTVRLYGER